MYTAFFVVCSIVFYSGKIRQKKYTRTGSEREHRASLLDSYYDIIIFLVVGGLHLFPNNCFPFASAFSPGYRSYFVSSFQTQCGFPNILSNCMLFLWQWIAVQTPKTHIFHIFHILPLPPLFGCNCFHKFLQTRLGNKMEEQHIWEQNIK